MWKSFYTKYILNNRYSLNYAFLIFELIMLGYLALDFYFVSEFWYFLVMFAYIVSVFLAIRALTAFPLKILEQRFLKAGLFNRCQVLLTTVYVLALIVIPHLYIHFIFALAYVNFFVFNLIRYSKISMLKDKIKTHEARIMNELADVDTLTAEEKADLIHKMKQIMQSK